MSEKVHRWLFQSLQVGYVDADGLGVHGEDYFLGTEAEAMAEGRLRADLANERQGMEDLLVVEGHGVE